MFNFKDLGSAQNKSIESLSEQLQHFNNQRKLVELDLEKRLLSLEDVLKDLKSSLGSLDTLQELKEFVTNIDYVRVKLRDLEDLSLIDKLEGVEVREKVSDLLAEQDELKQKVELLVKAMKNLDPNEGDMQKTLNSIQDMQSRLVQLDSVMKELQSTALKAVDIQPIIVKIDELETNKEVMKNDFQRLISTLREQLEIHDKRIIALQQDIAKEGNIAAIREHLSVHEKELEVLREHNRKLVFLVESKLKTLETQKQPSFEQQPDSYVKLSEKIVSYGKEIANLQASLTSLQEAIKDSPSVPSIDTSHFLRKDDPRVKAWDQTLQRLVIATQSLDDRQQKGLTELQQSQLKLFLQTHISQILGQVYAYTDKVKESVESYKVSLSKEIDDLHLKLASGSSDQSMQALQRRMEALDTSLKQLAHRMNESTIKQIDNASKLSPEATEQVKATIEEELSDVLENLTEIGTSLREEQNQLKASIDSRIDLLEKQMEANRQSAGSEPLESKLASLETRIKEYESHMNQQYMHQVESLRKRVLDLESDLAKTRTAARSVSKEEVDELNQRLHDVEAKSSALFDSLEKMHVTIQRGVSDLSRNVYAKMTAESKSLHVSLSSLQEQIRELQGHQFEEKQSPADAVPANIAEHLKTILLVQKEHEETLQAMQKAHEKEINELRVMIAKGQNNRNEFQKADESLTQRFDQLRKENATLKKELEQVRDALLRVMQQDQEHPYVIE